MNNRDQFVYNKDNNTNEINSQDMFTNNQDNIFINEDNHISKINPIINHANLNDIDLRKTVIDNFSVFPNSNIKNDGNIVSSNIVIDNIEPVKINNSINNNDDTDKIQSKTVQRDDNYVFTDGLDEIDDDKKGLKNILVNKKFLLVVAVLCFIFVSIVVAKAFYFGKKTRDYEEFFVEIEKERKNILKYIMVKK